MICWCGVKLWNSGKLGVGPTSGDCPDTRALVQRIQAGLQAFFHLRVPIALASAGSLPRFRGMKASRWLVANRPSGGSTASLGWRSWLLVLGD